MIRGWKPRRLTAQEVARLRDAALPPAKRQHRDYTPKYAESVRELRAVLGSLT